MTHRALLSAVLTVLGIVCLLVGALHLAIGPRADVMLGGQLPPAVLVDPVFDSQNRFYGVMFAGYGALLLLIARAPAAHGPALKVFCIFFFIGGLARILSSQIVGMPSATVILLATSELLIPPALWWLYNSAISNSAANSPAE